MPARDRRMLRAHTCGAGSLLPSPPLWGDLQPVLQLQTAVSPPELLELEAQTTGSQMSPSMMSPSMMFERAEHEVPTAVELRSLAGWGRGSRDEKRGSG